MQAVSAQQSFGMGILIADDGYRAPTEVAVDIDGYGIFAKIGFIFRFSSGVFSPEQIFVMFKPADAVIANVLIDGKALESGLPPDAAREVSGAQLQSLVDIWGSCGGHALTLEVSSERDYLDIQVDFILSMEIVWHLGAFNFVSPVALPKILFKGRWDLAVLPSAELNFREAAASCRLQALGGSRFLWNDSLSAGSFQPLSVELALDEKKPASIAVFSQARSKEERSGCAAISVIAPVRPQLAGEVVRLAVLVEVQNPQEGLLIRRLLENIGSLLRPEDKICLHFLKEGESGEKLCWTSPDALSDDVLGRLLEPAKAGRALDLWQTMHAVVDRLGGATGVVLASSGLQSYPPPGLLGRTPVFVFAMGRTPFRDQLSSLAFRSGGFIEYGISEHLDTVLAKLRIRLCPPLLSDFKIEGWGLTDTYPSGASRVFIDQPTILMGLYEGLLPNTVTLTGCSPTGHQLAQRVKVDVLDNLDLMPLYLDRVAHWDGEKTSIDRWAGEGARVLRISHVQLLTSCYIEKAAPSPKSTPEPFQESGVAFAETSVDMNFFARPSLEIEADSFFSQDTPSWMQDKDLFASSSMGADENEIVFGAEVADEIDLFSTTPAIVNLPVPKDSSGGEAELLAGPALGDEPYLNRGEPEETTSPQPLEPDIKDAPSLPKDEPEEVVSLASAGSETKDSAALSDEPIQGDEPLQADEPLVFEGEPEKVAPPRPAKIDAADAALSQGTSACAWLNAYSSLEPETARRWLEEVPIDRLSLALSLLDKGAAEALLGELDPFRQRAVRTQVAWAFFLSEDVRIRAGNELLGKLS